MPWRKMGHKSNTIRHMFTILKNVLRILPDLLHVTQDILPLPVCSGMDIRLTFCLCLLRLRFRVWQPKPCLCPGKSQSWHLARSSESWTMTSHAFCHDCIDINIMGSSLISTPDLIRTYQFSARLGLAFTEHASSSLAAMDLSFGCGLHFELVPVSIFSVLCPCLTLSVCGVSSAGYGPEFCTPPGWQSLYASLRHGKPSERWINTEARECGWQEDRTDRQKALCLSLARLQLILDYMLLPKKIHFSDPYSIIKIDSFMSHLQMENLLLWLIATNGCGIAGIQSCNLLTMGWTRFCWACSNF